jgi:hypothetical protein
MLIIISGWGLFPKTAKYGVTVEGYDEDRQNMQWNYKKRIVDMIRLFVLIFGNMYIFQQKKKT